MSMTLKFKPWSTVVAALLLYLHHSRFAQTAGVKQIDEDTYDFSKYSHEIPRFARPLAMKFLNLTEQELMTMHPMDIAVLAKNDMQKLPRLLRRTLDIPPPEVIDAWERRKAAEKPEKPAEKPEKPAEKPAVAAKTGIKVSDDEESAASKFLHVWLPIVLVVYFLVYICKPFKRRLKRRNRQNMFQSSYPCYTWEKPAHFMTLSSTSEGSFQPNLQPLASAEIPLPTSNHAVSRSFP